MANEDPPQQVDPHQVSEIVGRYVRHHQVPTDQLTALIIEVHRALAGLPAPVQEPPRPAVPIRRSGAAGLCRLPRVRISRADVAPAFAGRARACGRPISVPLEFTGGLPGDSTGVFRSPVEARQEARARTSRRAGTEPSGNRATRDPASRSPAAASASDIASTVLLALRRTFSARLQYMIMSFI